MVVFDSLEDIFQTWRSSGDYQRSLVTLATAIGTILVVVLSIKATLKFLTDLRLYVFSQCCCKTDYVKRHGKWAVITGSTDGIGRSMAMELARRGHSIIVVARNEEKLLKTKEELEREEGVGEVITVKIDFSDSSLENYQRIQNEIDPEVRDIGILINNVGFFADKFALLHNFDDKHLKTIVDVNMLSPVLMTRMIIPGMLRRQRGMIVNVSSMFGTIPSPYTGVYGSTKTFLDSFSLSLQEEYKSSPVKIVNLTPGAVTTKLFLNSNRMQKPSLFAPSPDDYARSAINSLSTTIWSYSGHISHAVVEIGAVVTNWLGLVPLSLRLGIRMTAKNYNLSDKIVDENVGGDTHVL